MAIPSIPDAALAAGGKIGRYFSIVTLVPTLFLVLWVYAVASSGAWWGPPDTRRLSDELSSWSVAKVGWLLFATLVIALFMHPLQYATVQLLEGYWGVSRLGLGAMRIRIRHHRRHVLDLEELEIDHRDAIDERFEEWSAFRTGWDEAAWSAQQIRYLDSRAGDPAVPHLVARDAVAARRSRYPQVHRVMPTRLGNKLRRYEDRAGTQYGLAATITAPHFALVIPEAHLAYVRDSRQLLDTTVRLCFVSLLAALLTASATVTDGWWLLVALLPYSLAYLSYRAAISAADEYGTAVATVIDLDRFLLYDSLGVPRPSDTGEERDRNADLMALLGGDDQATVTYGDTKPRSFPGAGLIRRLLHRRGT